MKLALDTLLTFSFLRFQVNKTFQELGILRDLGGMWEETRPKVWNFMENSEEINLMRVSFSLLSSLPPSGDMMQFPCVNFILNILFFQTQTLLRNNATANFFSAQLAGTQWSVEDVVSFLSKHSEDTRPYGTAFTWRDVFNETDQAIMSISRFMEVRKYLSFCACLLYFSHQKHLKMLILNCGV